MKTCSRNLSRWMWRVAKREGALDLHTRTSSGESGLIVRLHEEHERAQGGVRASARMVACVCCGAQVVLRPGAETLSIEAQLRQGGRDGDEGDEGGGGDGCGGGNGEALGAEGTDTPGVVKSEEVGLWQSIPLVRPSRTNGRRRAA